jgi:hypothetical protein
MTQAFLLLGIIALFVFMYHYERNGNPWNSGDFIARILWGLTFGAGYGVLSFHSFHLGLYIWLCVAGFLELLIPHGFAMNMGRWAQPWSLMPAIKVLTWKGKDIMVPKCWPAIFLPQFDQAGWDALPMWKRTALDFGGMGLVGLYRGILGFVPAVLFGLSWHGAALGVLVTMLGQPISYFVGKYTPWTIWTNAAYSSQWGEFYVPIAWALALLFL